MLLRRKLDARFPNQRAEVFVADGVAGRAAAAGPFQHAGTFYLAGGSTVLVSDPPDELGGAETRVLDSGRRWRQDELVLPAPLTHGRRALRVRLVFAPTHAPLTPEMPVPEEAFSEVRYDTYSYISPLP